MTAKKPQFASVFIENYRLNLPIPGKRQNILWGYLALFVDYREHHVIKFGSKQTVSIILFACT